MKLCICVIGKRENKYAKEFIQYYLNLGYDHIFVYDNNDINEECFFDILKEEVNKGLVSIIDYRGYLGKKNLPQFDAFIDCYHKNFKKYDWLSFFDFDEYLEFQNNIKIRQFLNNKVFNKCEENKSLQIRFSKPLLNHIRNILTKSIVRGNLTDNYWKTMTNPHTSIGNYTACSSSGKLINNSSPYNNPIETKNVYLKHYSTKIVEEFCNKIKRGNGKFSIR